MKIQVRALRPADVFDYRGCVRQVYATRWCDGYMILTVGEVGLGRILGTWQLRQDVVVDSWSADVTV